MPFNIGKVLSPEVAAGLIRRGESSGGGGYIRRDPDTTTILPEDPAAELALLREERLDRESRDAEARALRGEDFAREQFEFQMSEAEKNRIERGEERKGKTSQKEAEGEARTLSDARKQGQTILKEMAAVLARARKPNPDTGKPDPDAVAEAQTIAQAMWGRFQALPLPDDEKKAALEAMRGQLQTTPASRAGAAPGAPEPPSPFQNEGEAYDEIASRMNVPNPDPMSEEQIASLPPDVLMRLPQGAMLHSDGTMTLLDGRRVPIPGLKRPTVAGGGSPTGYVDPTLGAEIGIPTRTP